MLLAAFAAALMPAPIVSVSAWAEQHRVVSAESGSPYPGKWHNDLTPHLVEFMDCLGFDDPCRSVAVKKSAQSAFSEGVLNAIGRAISVEPCPILVLLPSLDEQLKYNRVKLQPLLEETPDLKRRIFEVVSRDGESSTVAFKRFRGGFLQTTTASSSKGLQMISARFRIYEEVSEYPADVDGRGEPTAIADARSIAWKERGDKAVFVSTPGLKGSCRVTAEFERGDQRRLYMACPHCGQYQVIRWQDLRWLREDRRPYGAHVVCQANGCIVEATDRLAMIGRQAWLPAFPSADAANPAPPAVVRPDELAAWRGRDREGREPSFAFWQAQSKMVPWDEIVHAWLQAQGDPQRLKAFWQQWLGEPWEVQGEAPEVDRLLERRQKWGRARIPAGVLFLTGAVDVQGDRLEWAIYGWGRDFSQHAIDHGVLTGSPEGDEVWLALDGIRAGRYADAWGKEWPVDAWGVDAGYLSQRVYRYVQARAGAQRIYALDGRPGWKLPALGTPRTVDVDYDGRKLGGVQLWPVGTWDLKGELYWSLRQTLKGPGDDGRWPAGCFWLHDGCDRTFLEQLTAEYLADVRTRHGAVVREWKKKAQSRNEQHDLAVYARALARHETIGMTDEAWTRLEVERLGPVAEAQLDLAALWVPGLAAGSPVSADASPSPSAETGQPAPAETGQEPAASSGGWVGRREGWLRR